MNKFANFKISVLVYSLIIFAIWSVLIFMSAVWNIQIEKNITEDTVKNIARASFNKDQAYRLWATSHGGVYVKPTQKTPPSPWMAHLSDRDLTTTDGTKLTLMNPAYMLREMMDDYSELYGIKGRIVGIVYLNPNNEADEWEAKAIKSFEQGRKEIMDFTNIEGEKYLRLMRPMIMNQKCQKCHGHLGFPNGSVRGGVSVSVPMKKYIEHENESVSNIKLTYFIIWAIGVIAIVVISLKSLKYLYKQEKYLEEIMISSEFFSNTLEAVFITDINGKILRINKAFTDLTGYTEDEVIGKNANILKSTHHKKEFYENLWKTLLEKGYYQNEVWNRNKDGEIFVSIESISSIKHDNGDIKYFISSLHDITAKKDAEERVVHMAHFDPLTDLPNRVLFQDRFKHAIDIAKRNNNKLALAFIDIDGFKNVNDTKGHPVGDKLLVKISKIISNCIRDSDTISRLGGDEFTIIFENIESTDDIVYICKDILDNVSKEIIIDDMSIYVSASIGISVYPNDGEDIHILLQHADTAMYKSKDEGKNRISFYEKDMTEKANDKVLIETSLQTAIKNNEFLVHYQPKIDLETNKVIGAEALVRWISLGEGFIPPDKFIPIAEQMRIVDKIDLYVLETVCKDMSTWIDMGYRDIKVAVNLSGYDISVATLYEKIVAIVEKYGVSAKNIEFEITETYFANFSDDCLIKLNKLKDYGFTLSIDDFGTGYSSLSNLRKLPIDILKIDQSFIRTMNESSENQKFVDTIINFANILNLKTIAEGVETIYHFEYLKSKKCTFMQGYFESKPLPKSEFIEYLKNKQ